MPPLLWPAARELYLLPVVGRVEVPPARPTLHLVVVAHGTVITLFVSRFADFDALRFWRRLGLPSFCVLQLPGYELREVVADLAEVPDD